MIYQNRKKSVQITEFRSMFFRMKIYYKIHDVKKRFNMSN